jgi:hypothetical protein
MEGVPVLFAGSSLSESRVCEEVILTSGPADAAHPVVDDVAVAHSCGRKETTLKSGLPDGMFFQNKYPNFG